MTNKMIDNRVRKIEEIEAEIASLKEKADALKEELKRDMDAKGVDVIDTGKFVLYYKEVVSNKFDTTAFKKEHGDLYKMYLKTEVTRPFKKYAV